MLFVQANSLAEAWREAFRKLYATSRVPSEQKLLKEDMLVLSVADPFAGDRTDPLFPMTPADMDEYNRFILHGGETTSVAAMHQLYHDRLFGFPPTNNDQIVAIIDLLTREPDSKRAQAVLWYPEVDQKADKVPCAQVLWVRISDGKLVMHVHMRANDAYKKLLMNMNIFSVVQKHIADALGIPVGEYVHFVDSFHLYREDEEAILELAKVL